MYWLLGIISLSLIGIVALGIYYELRPPGTRRARGRFRGAVAMNLMAFVLAEVGLLFFAANEALAQPAAETGAGPAQEASVGLGLALIGIGIPTALATIGAGIAVASVGASALAVLAEKPEVFGRTLVYLGLAEGIAIYGLVVSILMLGRLP